MTKVVERIEDMSRTGRLTLLWQNDGDIIVEVIEEDGRSAGVEFCSSGGHSPRTLAALRALFHAMEADNA